MENKSTLKKVLQCSGEETKCLFVISTFPKIQQKVEGSTCKTKLYAELADKLAKAEFHKTK